jgi:hypothetical protein
MARHAGGQGLNLDVTTNCAKLVKVLTTPKEKQKDPRRWIQEKHIATISGWKKYYAGKRMRTMQREGRMGGGWSNSLSGLATVTHRLGWHIFSNLMEWERQVIFSARYGGILKSKMRSRIAFGSDGGVVGGNADGAQDVDESTY